MIARLLRGLWLIALCGTTAVAWWASQRYAPRFGPWFPAALVVFLAAAVHPVLIGCNFVASRLAGDRVPGDRRLSPWAWIRTWDAEVDASMRGVWFATPFRGGRPTPSPIPPLRRTALLFLHGYLCNRAVWHAFMRDAAARGYRCEALTLADPFASIDSHDQSVAEAIRASIEAGADRVVLIGHSMGGLVARSAMQRIDRSAVAHVITLGTPHHGTHAARYGRATSVSQMRRDSGWLAALAAREAAGHGLPLDAYTTLFSWHDDIVYPQSTGRLAGADAIAVAGIGHVALLYDRRVRALVFERLDAIDERVPPVAQAVAGEGAS